MQAMIVVGERISAWRYSVRILIILAVAGLLAGTSPSVAEPAADIPQPALPLISRPPASQQPTTRTREAWRELMARIPAPKTGCYAATYPSAQWQEVPCTTAPKQPYVVGKGGAGDSSAQANGGSILSAIGQLKVTGVTSVSDGSGPSTFSLQLNTNTFATDPNAQPATLCKDSQGNNLAGCSGWEQFIYSNSSNCKSGGSCVFIQYWLLNHPSPCPTTPTVANNSWTFAPATAGASSGCYINGQATPVPNQTALNFGELILTASGGHGGQAVTVETSAGTLYGAIDPSDLLGIGSNWNTAEFNLFGDCCTKVATFNLGATVVVTTRLITTAAVPFPTCPAISFTAESNSLTLLTPCCPLNSGAITFTESNAAGATSACACQAGTSWDPNSATCVPPAPVPPVCSITFWCPTPDSHGPPDYKVTCPGVVDFYESLPNTPKFPLETAASVSGTTDAYAEVVYACTTGTQTCTGFSIYKDVPDWCGGGEPAPNPQPNPQRWCLACMAAGGTCTVGPHGRICQ